MPPTALFAAPEGAVNETVFIFRSDEANSNSCIRGTSLDITLN